jgi:hypothetical protein
MTYVKKSRTKLYLAVILALILIGAAGAAAFAVMFAPKPPTAGVKVGDTFTYSIKGLFTKTALNATPTAGFDQFNKTDYFKVTITAVNGTSVSMDTTWRFLNGTEVNSTQNMDIANGNKTDTYGFWALYPTNLNIGDLVRPQGYDGNTVNNTYSASYISGNRTTDFWFINNQFSDRTDPTGNTQMVDYLYVYFDQHTGIMIGLQDYKYYNNPERNEGIIWTLIDSSVWQV